MTLTIKQKQAVYEHLLNLRCDDLLAALIAERSDTTYIKDMGTLDKSKIESWIVDGFDWFLTPEGHYFWNDMYDCVLDFKDLAEPSVDECFGYVIEDIKHEGKPLVIAPVLGMGFTDSPDYLAFKAEIEVELKPSFIDKVKVWLGKLSYKV